MTGQAAAELKKSGISPVDREIGAFTRMIADFFQRIGAVEKIGAGITWMKELMVSSGLPEPKYEFTSFFTVIFTRRPQVTPQVTTERAECETLLRRVYGGVQVRLSRDILKIYEQKTIKRKELDFFTISIATAERDIALLKGANGRGGG